VNILQQAFDRVSFDHLIIKLISQKAEEHGYSLTDEQLATIEEQISIARGDAITIELPDDQDINLQIDIEDEDVERILGEFSDELLDSMPKIIDDTSQVILADLKSRAPEMLLEHAEMRSRFENAVSQSWGNALDLLEMFVVIAAEAGEDFNEEFRPSASQDSDFEFDVLTRLHARSCQIANEVLTLLRAGYADGAHARWRTIHEIAVVALFINKFGQDTAERYFLHNTIESYRAARLYQRHYARLGYEPITDHEISQLQSLYEELLNRFGRPFANAYGWATQAIGNRDPKFSDIEQAVDLEHWRPHYKFASHNVHANSKGILSKLGLYRGRPELLLAGPSVMGFTDHGHGTAVSLLQITMSLLTTKPNIDRLCVCTILSTLAGEIGETFLSIQKGQEKA
jgi:hypothetical protein